MSPRPDVPRLAEEELDLLISRSLDGDLSPEEEQRLDRLVALDPSAARRKAAVAALVADAKALPELATPFALATRVNANVAERAGRPGSLGGRLGFFPPPGLAKAALFVVGIVGVAIAILRPVPKRSAEGPVEVLLLNPQQPAAPAPRSLIAEAKPARVDDAARRQETDELVKRAPAGESAAEKDAEKRTSAKAETAARNEPAGVAGAHAVADAGSKRNVALDEGAVSGGAVAQAPAKIASSAEAAAPAPARAAAPAAGARAMKAAAAAPRRWTVAVVGDAASRWALRRAPDSYPAPASNLKSVFRVTLDASGRVASARFTGSGTAEPGLEEFVRGMVFEPAPRAEGALRDAKKKDSAQAAAAGAEIEIELAPR